MDARIERLVVDALYEELIKLPLNTKVTAEELADASPRLTKGDNGNYTLAGESEPISGEDIADAAYEALWRIKDTGPYVDEDFEHDCFSLHEYMPPEELDFDGVESMQLQYGAALHIDKTEFKYDHETLSMTIDFQGRTGFEKHAVYLGESTRNDLSALFRDVDVQHWEREYEPQDLVVMDGYDWSLAFHFSDGRVFVSGGSNAWPETFADLWDGLCKALGLVYRWEE